MNWETAAKILSENLKYKIDYLSCCDIAPGTKTGWIMQSEKAAEFVKETFGDLLENGYLIFERQTKMKNTLHLTLKKEWFDMIATGVKKEEYREIKEYWTRRLVGNWHQYESNQVIYKSEYMLPYGIDRIEFRNGYKPDSPRIVVEWIGLEVGKPNMDWFPKDGDLEEDVFILKLGNVIG